jgi:polyisoprenoid-binding protein YceI
VARAAVYGAHMALAPGTYPIGPHTGTLHLRTAREGVAAKVGHDLLVEMKRWSGTLTVVDDPSAAAVAVDVDMGSFTVLEGTGGVAALSAGDRKDITATALKLMDVSNHPHAMFRSTAVTPGDSGGTLEGTLTVRDHDGDVSLAVTESGPDAWAAAGSLLQSAYGIKPYRAFFGALRVADPIGIEVVVDLSSAVKDSPGPDA